MEASAGVLGYFWREESRYVLGMVGVLAAILLRARSVQARTLLGALGLFLAALAGQFASAIVHVLGFASAASMLRETFVLAEGIAVIQLWGLLLFRIVLPLARLRPARIVEDIAFMIAYVAWGLVRLRYAGMDLSSLVTTSALITAVLAFAMQDTLGNLLGGIALQLDKSVQTGDWVKVDNIVGRVGVIRWRSTAIETRDWETIVIPNSVLMKGRFAVLGRRSAEPLQLRRWVWFNVDFATPAAKVVGTVEEALREARIAGVAAQPEPSCVLMEFDGGFARYGLRYWLTDLLNDDLTDGAVRTHVLTALQRAGIRLAVPEYSVHTVSDDERHRRAVMAREMARRLSALRCAELFSTFRDEELDTVAERLVYAPFAKGAIITRQGRAADRLYIMTSGEAEVVLEAPGQDPRSLNVLRAGSFFGEMGLMTGAPRAATVIARTDVECYRLDKAAFEDVLRSRPTLAEEMAQIILTRRDVLESAQQDMHATLRLQSMSYRRTELLTRIRRFFGLCD